MATKVTRIWSVVITALLAFFASLGLIATPAAAAPAAPQQDSTGSRSADVTVEAPYVATAPQARPYELNRPPTMKQRIHAEAHGSSPRSRGLTLATPLSDVNQVGAATEAEVVQGHIRAGKSEEPTL